MKNFYIIATPIGNLGDVTFRAVEILRNVDAVLCEDTRVAARLLNRYEIRKPLVSYHQRSKSGKTEKILGLIREGKELALVSDAGTPGISDPGNELVRRILDEFADEAKLVPVPGPSALTAIVQVAGIDMTKFVFLGFPPHKKGRQKFFSGALSQEIPVVYFDSPYRFVKNLELIKKLSEGKEQDINFVVGRELTKIFEEVTRGSLEKILQKFSNKDAPVRGEFVVVMY